MREAIDTFRGMGDLGHLASYGPALADALIPQGRFEEALMLTEEAERVAIQGDMDAQVHWRRVRAKIFAHRERVDEAIALATEAADLARRTDDLDKVGRSLLDLAEVLSLAGRVEAKTAACDAIEVFERKGNIVLAERARELLGRDIVI